MEVRKYKNTKTFLTVPGKECFLIFYESFENLIEKPTLRTIHMHTFNSKQLQELHWPSKIPSCTFKCIQTCNIH